MRVWDHVEIPSDLGRWTPAETWTDHACRDDCLLVFPSTSLHESPPTSMPEGEFADRRFSIVTAALRD